MTEEVAVRARLSAAVVAVAGLAGSLVRTLPGVLGATSIVLGLGLIYVPLAFLAAGVFLLVIDRRVP